MRHLIPIIAVAGLLAACAPSPGGAPSNQTASAEGCRSGYLIGGLSNNYVYENPGPAYETDAGFRQAYDAGFERCYNRAISNPRRR